MRGRRQALSTMLAWLGLLSLLLTGLPVLERTQPGNVTVLTQAMEERPAGGSDSTAQEEVATKPRRLTTLSAPAPMRAPPSSSPSWQALTNALPAPLIGTQRLGSMHAAPIPATPGLRQQRGQAPPAI